MSIIGSGESIIKPKFTDSLKGPAHDELDAMPSVPDTDDVKSVGMDSVTDGAVYGLGTSMGGQVAGPLGQAGGGVLAGASIGGQKGETLATLSLAQAIQAMFMGGGSSGGSSRGVK